jgi:hypothetical protein
MYKQSKATRTNREGEGQDVAVRTQEKRDGLATIGEATSTREVTLAGSPSKAKTKQEHANKQGEERSCEES